MAIIVSVQWDAVRYDDRITIRCTGQNPAAEATIMENYPPIYSPPARRPAEATAVVDRNGVILFWYLPSVLTIGRQVCGWFQIL